jgi:putative membrane protein
MRSFIPVAVFVAVFGLGAFVLAPMASANDKGGGAAPSTAEVLGKLHHSNVREIRMGEMAREHGKSKDVKDFGNTLVKDHTAADTKVSKLAKEENIDLAAKTPEAGANDMNMSPNFDTEFAKTMLEDHKKDIAEVEKARDATSDAKLKSLLKEILPVLKKHETIAQKLVDQGEKSRPSASK